MSRRNRLGYAHFVVQSRQTNEKEDLKRLWNQIDEHKSPKAMNMMGVDYFKGQQGLSKNLKKAEELYQQAYDLAHPSAAHNLYELYRSKHIPDEDRMMKCLEEGVKRGNADCMINLGIRAARSGNHEEAKRQLMTTARAGNKNAVLDLMVIYRTPGSVVSKDDLTTTLRAHQAANDTRTSEPREYAKRHHAFEEKIISGLKYLKRENQS